MKMTKKELLLSLGARQKIITLTQLIVQGNKDYSLRGDFLIEETLKSLKNILTDTKNNSEITSEFNRITVKTSEKNIFIAEEAIKRYKKIPQEMKERDWLLKNICSLPACR